MYQCIARMTFKVIEEPHDIWTDIKSHRTNHLIKNPHFINGDYIFINPNIDVMGSQRIL